jgi:hypothetical protein
MADQVTTKARSMVERMLDPNLQDQLTKRGRTLAEAIGEAAETASGRAATTWRDAEPMRREAARTGREALLWSRRTWRREMQPSISRLWSRRSAALGAAGAAVPVARELFEDAAVRLGIRTRREQRHWGTFFAGLLIGAAVGLIAAVLTAPKAGREMRGELAETARDAATRAREVATTRAREVATRAREAAASAGEWVPIFQRPDAGDEANGTPVEAVEAVDAVEAPEAMRPAPSRKRAASSIPLDETDKPA